MGKYFGVVTSGPYRDCTISVKKMALCRLKPLINSATYMRRMNPNSSALDAFVPQLPADRWEPIQEFVRRSVHVYTLTHSPGLSYLAMMHMTMFADWVCFTGVTDLDETALSAAVIDAYTAHRSSEVRPVVAERERKVLRTLAGIAPTVEKRAISTVSDPGAPYTRTEQGQLRNWAMWQGLPARMLRCTAIAALGLGCGLTSAEMAHVRANDIVALEDGMLGVHVTHSRMRTVPVLAEWNDELESVRAGTTGFIIAPHVDNRRSELLKVSIKDSRGALKPTVQRMRNTWLLTLIDNSVPLPVIMEAAGLTSPDSLRRLIAAHARVPSVTEQLTLLRQAKKVAA